jgi:hypothetical protein
MIFCLQKMALKIQQGIPNQYVKLRGYKGPILWPHPLMKLHANISQI